MQLALSSRRRFFGNVCCVVCIESLVCVMWLGAYGMCVCHVACVCHVCHALRTVMCVMLCVDGVFDGVSVRCVWRQLNYNSITQDGLLPPILTSANGVVVC